MLRLYAAKLSLGVLLAATCQSIGDAGQKACEHGAEQSTNRFHGFSTGRTVMFAPRSGGLRHFSSGNRKEIQWFRPFE
jgi:hypothetical protein